MKQAGFERLARETESAARAAKSAGERAALLTIAQSYRSLAARANDPFLLVGEPSQRTTFPPAVTAPMRLSHSAAPERRRARKALRQRAKRTGKAGA